MAGTLAVYPGSFKPFHEGHQDIIDQALKVFDSIIILRCINKNKPQELLEIPKFIWDKGGDIIPQEFCYDILVEWLSYRPEVTHVIRGLRNSTDFEYEKSMLYNNQDLGLKIPVVYFIADRSLTHISSSAIREIESFK